MNARQGHDLARRLADAIPEAIADAGLRNDTCILATRIATHVLRAADVRAQAHPTQLKVLNAPYRNMIQEQIDRADAGEPEFEADDYERCQREGAWSVMIGPEAPRGVNDNRSGRGWDGHLVCSVAGRWLLDPTLGQANRPEKGIILRPLVTDARDFLRGDVGFLAIRETASDCTVVYQQLDDTGYLTAPDWTLCRASDRIVRDVQRRIAKEARRAA